MLQRLHALHDHLTGLAAAQHQQRQRLDSRDSNDSDNTTDSDNTADSDKTEDTPSPRTTHSTVKAARKRRRLEAAFMSPTEQQEEEERRSCKRSKLGHWSKAEHNMTTQTSPGALLETSD